MAARVVGPFLAPGAVADTGCIGCLDAEVKRFAAPQQANS